ncbi:MAG: Bacterial domain [Gammaproteobacteria bacterium]|jgi:membrane protein YdbS with pleckstrin-like domain|nr:Bacterial domain [Gammaproteobacteria bacterium]
MELSAGREQYPLSKKSIFKKTLLAWLFIPMNIAIITFAFTVIQPNGWNQFSGLINMFQALAQKFFFNSGLAVVICLLAISFAICYVFQILNYKSYDYEINDKSIMIKKGVLSVRQINIPFTRIQDVYVDQDFLDRIFGLYDLHISDAAMYSAGLTHIDGLDKDSADKLHALILSQIKQ